MVPIKQSANNKKCPPEQLLLETLSGKWVVMIIYTLSDGSLRHSELRRSIEGISQKILTQSLRNLERHGIIERKVYPVVPPHVEYSLTSLGISLLRPLAFLFEWAQSHRSEVAKATRYYDEAARKQY